MKDLLICLDCGHMDFDHMFYNEHCLHGSLGHTPEDPECECVRFA